ncbi:Protein kinase, catalytic domain-containing protein [Artemisia annua]|uniref:Protein kinase, catalytic domain-containing protein n=1 Tax=Artemisia annua TaxID=35608 RepID=A0A2U1P400_ARTAN|nr:Protein kinase, catalytic domain-containing protein [Artemisia annua]
MDATSTDMAASTSSSIAKPEKFYFDELPKEMHEMKIKEDKMENKVVIGPATVRGIQAGAFKIGDTAGFKQRFLYVFPYIQI